MFIDTHCHINFQDFDADRAMVIGNAKKAGVKQFIVPGVDIRSSLTAIHLASLHPDVIFPTAGIGWHEAENEPDIGDIEKLVDDGIVAIGECGLDYHLYKGEPAIGKKDRQKRLFSQHLTIAIIHHLPVIIHCREAFDDCFDVIDSMATLPQGIFHCFSGGKQEIRAVAARGMYMGIDGNITFSKQLSTIVSAIPPDRLLLETDAPYLTPVPHRGMRNEPKYLPLTAEMIANNTGKTKQQIAEETTMNARRIFRLS